MQQVGFNFAPPANLTSLPSLRPLRPHQEAAVEGGYKALVKWSDALVIMATGTGKTRCFTEMARLWPIWKADITCNKSDRVLVLAERDSLITQAIASMHNETGELIGREQANYRSAGERIVVSSIQTLLRPQRLESFRPDAFGLVVYDEVHHLMAETRAKIVKRFRDGGSALVGVTATPDRRDEKSLGKMFRCCEDGPSYVYDIWDAIADGWLVDFDIRPIKVDLCDFSKVRKVRGDLSATEVEEVICKEDVLHEIADPLVKETGDLRCLTFMPGVASSKLISAICNRYAHPGWSHWMAGQGDMDIEVRRKLIESHHRDDFTCLINCDVATEGYDDPKIGCIGMAAPTMSRAKFAQRIGRGTRPVWPKGFDENRATAEERRAAIASSTKPKCRIIEFTGNMGKHNLACTTDVLGAPYDPEIVERAKKQVAKDGGSPSQALVRALKEAEDERIAELARRAHVMANVSYHVDPFELLHMDSKKDRWAKRFDADPATDPQKGLLMSFGMSREDVKHLTKPQASRLIDACSYRKKFGKARFSQLAKMSKVDIDGSKLSYQQACDICWEIQQNRGKRPPQPVIDAIVNRQCEPGSEG